MASNDKLIRIILKLQDDLSTDMGKAVNTLDKFASQATKAGAALTVISAPLIAAGVAGAKMAMDLDTAMRNIQSITKQTDESLAELSDAFVALSTDMSKTTDSAQNLAEAYYLIIGSGIDAADAMSVLEVATKAASAGLTETAVAAEAIVGTLNAYGLSADQAASVSDILFETVNRGVGSFEELAGSMSNVTGLANSLGVPLEEVAAAMATMSKQGMSFSEASVALNQAMSNLISPTAEGQKIIEAMGYSSGQAMVEALGFAGALQAIEKHTGGSTTEMQKLFSNVRGLRAALALTGDGAAMFAEDMAAMAAAAGSTEAAFAEQMKSFEAVWKNFQNTFNALLIELGQTILPLAQQFIQGFLIPLIQGFRSLPEPVQQVVIGLLAIVAAVGPLLLIVGQLASAWAAIAGIMPMVITGFTAFMALGAPVIALIAAIVVAIGLLIANWNQLGTTISQLATIVDQAFDGAFSKARDSLIMLSTAIWETAKNMAKGFYEMGAAIINGLLNGIKSKAVDLIAYIFGLSKEMTAAVKKALGISSPSKVMMEMGENVVAGFHKGIESMGGIGVTTPGTTASGAGMPTVGGGLAMAGGGGGNVYIGTLTVPPGTSNEQIDYIMKEIGKRTKMKSGGALGNGK